MAAWLGRKYAACEYLLRQERARRPASRAVRLLPVQVAVERVEQMIQVDLGGGLGLRVAAGTEPNYVATLVAAL